MRMDVRAACGVVVAWSCGAAWLAGQDEEGPEELAELALYGDSILRGRPGDAIQGLEDYLADFPDSARAELLRLEALYRRGDIERVRRGLTSAREKAEEQGVLAHWAVLACDVALEWGRADEAEAALNAGLAADAADVRLLRRQVDVAVARGDRDAAMKAIDALPDTSRDESGDPRVLLEHARAWAALGHAQPADSFAVYAEALFRRDRDPRRGQALVTLGDVYRLARYEDGIPALRAYHDALEIDRTLASAHVGTAKVHVYRMSYDKAEEAVGLALSVRPDFPDAMAVRAELQLVDRKFSMGQATAESVLASHPTHKHALACRAAAQWLLSGPDRESAVEAMLAVDPRYADGFRLIGDLVSQHYRFAEAIPLYERGIEVDPQWSTTYVGLARSLANTGQGEAALEALETFGSLDRDRYPIAKNLRISLQSVAASVKTERGPFDFHTHPSDTPVMAPLLWQLLEPAWTGACERYGLDPDRRIRVEVFAKHDDFSARSVGFTGFGALGVCFGDVFTLVSPSSEMRGSFHWERTAVHELMHVVALALSNQRVPRWLTEGMSVYEERVYAPYCDREMDRELLDYYASDDLLRVRDFNRAFGGPKILFGYYQGGLLCEFLVETHGTGILARMLSEYADDRETPDVVQRVLGVTPEELDEAFRTWVYETRVSKVHVQPTYTPEGRRMLLSRVRSAETPDPDDLVQLAWAYHRARRTVDRDDYIARARQATPKATALTFLLAEIALEQGERDRARDLLEAGVAAGGREFSAFLRLAELADDDAEAALAFLDEAKTCFPRYVGPGNPYVGRAQILEQLGRADEVLDELRAYCAIHESDASPRWTLVDAALERDDYAEAAQFLRELRAIDPFQRTLHRRLARCERALGEVADAEASLRMALAVPPERDPELMGLIGDGSAADVLDRSQRAEIWDELASLYDSLGEAEKASAARAEATALR